jgi:hypothetical protein
MANMASPVGRKLSRQGRVDPHLPPEGMARRAKGEGRRGVEGCGHEGAEARADAADPDDPRSLSEPRAPGGFEVAFGIDRIEGISLGGSGADGQARIAAEKLSQEGGRYASFNEAAPPGSVDGAGQDGENLHPAGMIDGADVEAALLKPGVEDALDEFACADEGCNEGAMPLDPWRQTGSFRQGSFDARVLCADRLPAFHIAVNQHPAAFPVGRASVNVTLAGRTGARSPCSGPSAGTLRALPLKRRLPPASGTPCR